MSYEQQRNHLKAYGIVYVGLELGLKSKWLLNYDGGAFLIENNKIIEKECIIRGVSYQLISDAKAQIILENISSPSSNQDAVTLEKAPKIAVYSPKDKMPWDDAVTLVLTYAEIPFDVIYDQQVLEDKLLLYEWLHLHHEDFTGQYGVFMVHLEQLLGIFKERKMPKNWLLNWVLKSFSSKISSCKKIRDYVIGGGFMFAMCSATDSFDIALSAEGVDIVESMFDGDLSEPNYQSKINFNKTFAFKDFQLVQNPTTYEFSSIDMTRKRKVLRTSDYFSLIAFSAKWDPVPTMLTQNHTQLVKGFMGQTTAFDPATLKANVLVLGENTTNREARYIHGTKGKGMFTFYGGHDPEDYTHRIGDPKTELELYPTSPGYRLILNNVLFPAAKKKKQKT